MPKKSRLRKYTVAYHFKNDTLGRDVTRVKLVKAKTIAEARTKFKKIRKHAVIDEIKWDK
jgi:hypothetical protein